METLGSLLFILPIVFWIWSLVDCLKSEWKNPSDRIVWFLVILFLNLFGSLLYVLIAPSKKVKKGGNAQVKG